MSAHPEVTVRRDGRERSYRAIVVEVPDVRAHVDDLMREKYGITDLLIFWLEGSPETVPVRLDPS